MSIALFRGMTASKRSCAMILLLGLIGCGQKDRLPPLLQHLSGGHGGYGSACPVSPDSEASVKKSGLADSPEFNERLQKKFPNGSPAPALEAMLKGIGFRSLGKCDSDPTIKIAQFSQVSSSNSPLSAFPMTATVYWKVDSNNRLVWTKGFVFYTGP